MALSRSVAAVITPDGAVEVLGSSANVQLHEVLEQRPHHYVTLANGWQLAWSSAAYQYSDINQFASIAAGQPVKGDACLLSTTGSCDSIQQQLASLLGSKHLQVLEPRIRARQLHMPHKGQSAQKEQQGSPGRIGSLQRTIAAQCTLNRILNHQPSFGVKQPLQARGCSANNSSSSINIQAAVGQHTDKCPCNRNASRISEARPLFPDSSMPAACIIPPSTPEQHEPSDCACVADESTSNSRGISRCSSSTHLFSPSWQDLPDGIASRIFSLACGGSVPALLSLCQTCSSWRRAALEDDRLLLQLRFCIADPQKPFRHSPWLPPPTLHARLCDSLPRLLERACKLNNVSALVSHARLLDAAGQASDALRLWRKAAKGGHVEAQLLLGLALYRGTHGTERDAEQAHMWLGRALRALTHTSEGVAGAGAKGDACMSAAAPASGADGTVNGAATASAAATAAANGGASACRTATASTAAAMASPTAPGLEPPSAALQEQVLAQAGLVLGYMHFDGEGERAADRQEAVRLFKLAAAHGSQEAASVLGWIFNTGQFG